MQPAEYAKAITGGLAGGLTALITALADGAVTAVEWATIALAVVATFGGVYQVRNAPPKGSRLHREAGRMDPLYVLMCVLVGLLIVGVFLYVFEPRG